MAQQTATPIEEREAALHRIDAAGLRDQWGALGRVDVDVAALADLLDAFDEVRQKVNSSVRDCIASLDRIDRIAAAYGLTGADLT